MAPHAFSEQACLPDFQFPNSELLATMQRGVNLPSWDHSEADERPTIVQLEALRSMGFTHIRLPLNNRPLSGSKSADYIKAIYEQVILLLSLDYTITLDLHPDDTISGLFKEDAGEGTHYLARIWIPLAKMARSLDPQKVALELLNEPQMTQEQWMTAAEELVTVLRGIMPEHTIIIGPAGPQRHEELASMQPLDDPNIIYAVHYYDPFLFTHQGANWGPPDDPLRLFAELPFPASLEDSEVRRAQERLLAQGESAAAAVLSESLEAPWDVNGIDSAFELMAQWSKSVRRPVIVNEFGVLSFVAPRQSRLRWLKTVANASSSRCIGWMHWDFKDGFGLIDEKNGMPDLELIEALGTAR